MKKVLFIALLALFTVQATAQRVPNEKKMSIVAGFL